MIELSLNRKKSYGTVYGHPQIGYEQEGQVFRHDGTVHIEPPKPAATDVSTMTAVPAAITPDVLKAIEGISSQIKDLKEPKGPDPARSEAARKIWAERRAREAEHGESSPETATP
jgi:hypothetical protein